MKLHLAQAQNYWKSHLHPGNRVVDATVGNGHDTVYLATLLAGKGELIGYDIQPAALEKTRERLLTLPAPFQQTIRLKEASHAHFEEKNVDLFVYNLGYLPGGDKSLTTSSESSLQSVQEALNLLTPGGAISLMTYPGHPEGEREHTLLASFFKTLSSACWEVCHHQWINRPASPTLFWIKSKSHKLF